MWLSFNVTLSNDFALNHLERLLCFEIKVAFRSISQQNTDYSSYNQQLCSFHVEICVRVCFVIRMHF